MSEPGPAAPDPRARRRLGLTAAAIVFAVYGGMALTIDVPATAHGFKSDEATYYLIGHSLARDGDLEYRRADLERAFAEYPSGPSGVFLKKGQTVSGLRLTGTVPFLDITGAPDPAAGDRLYFGKAFIYPAIAAPFVRVAGTNGFLLFNAVLLTAAFLTAYTYLSARTPPAIALVVAGAFVFATVVPVYATMILPELFNFTIGLLAYFFWLHKYGRQPGTAASHRFVSGPASDLIAALLIGVATYSKVTNVLLLLPMLAWLIARRQWSRAALVTATWGLVVAALFGLNVATSGDWNYQGGERNTFYKQYPFQTADAGFGAGAEMARNESLGGVIFDPELFWLNLRSNLQYFFVGRYSGLVAYFLPAVVAMLAMLAAPRRRPGWQWLVLGGIVAQMLVFVISQPYSYFGSGGSVGNRYFMGAYGMSLFLLPAMSRLPGPIMLWLVGGLFMAKLVLNPFFTAAMPYKHANAGPFRWLPVELTNVNDLPTNTNRDQMVFWYGEKVAFDDRQFQIYYLDDNVYLRELDRSFWVRGDSRGEVLIKANQPFRQLQLTLRAGPVPAEATVNFEGRVQHVDLPTPGAMQIVTFDMTSYFPYGRYADADNPPLYVWRLSITAGRGFVPKLLDPGSDDIRYLGVSVLPLVFR